MKESSTMNRRCFIKTLGVAGLGLSALPGMAMAAVTEPGNRVAKTKALMDTIVTITVRGVSNTQAQDAIGAAFQSMERHIAIFNRFDSATPISQLNTAGRLTDAPQELTALLSTAKTYHKRHQWRLRRDCRATGGSDAFRQGPEQSRIARTAQSGG